MAPMTRSSTNRALLGLFLSIGLGSCATSGATDREVDGNLASHLLFYASFDDGPNADVASADPKIYTRTGDGVDVAGLAGDGVLMAPGVAGQALNFRRKKRPMIFYRAARNMGFSPRSWSGAVSFWLQLDPATDLEPGYCDPIQITDTRYNDASIWVDFTKENPRQFRLGVIGDLSSWNPDGVEGNDNPEFTRRLVPMQEPPFERGTWTHVLLQFEHLNATRGRAELFVDGDSIGSVDVTDPFTWIEDEARIMLGLSYVGLMDELAIFDAPLTAAERARLRTQPSLKDLAAPR